MDQFATSTQLGSNLVANAATLISVLQFPLLFLLLFIFGLMIFFLLLGAWAIFFK